MKFKTRNFEKTYLSDKMKDKRAKAKERKMKDIDMRLQRFSLQQSYLSALQNKDIGFSRNFTVKEAKSMDVIPERKVSFR